VNVDLQEIVLGGGRTIAPFQFHAQFRGDRPVASDLSIESSGHGVHASLSPGTDRSKWSVQIDSVADLLAVGTSPLKELPAPMTAANTTIGGLIGLPGMFTGGSLAADGTLDLGNVASIVQGRLQIKDLKLRTEIPFFSNIAGLVKRQVKITVPFKEFRVDSFTLGQHDAHVQNAFVAGPIDFTAEKLDLDFDTTELFLRGKILGIWFEVKGQPGHLEYYLADKTPGLNLITTEDEFQW
jgi:hypothetical protein